MGIKCSLFGGPHCIFNALLLPLPHKQRELSEEQALGLLAVNNRPSTSGVVQLFLIPHDLYRLKEEIRGAAAWANVRCFFFCCLKLNYFEFEWRENCTRQFFDVASWRRVDPIFSIRHMWPNVSFLTRKQPCTACSSRRINYVWKEEASNFQCTNTLFALSFVFVLLLLLFVLRGLSTLLHFLAFVIPGENQCFLFPHILRFFFLTCPISYSLFFY